MQRLREELQSHCPGREPRQRLQPVDLQIDSHWKLQKRLKQLGKGVSMARIAFAALKTAAEAQKAYKTLKKACRQRKKAQLLAGLESIEQAARAGDSKAFYGFTKLVSPKPFLPKIKLRDECGAMLTRSQEGELLSKYAGELFDGQSIDLPPLLPVPEHLLDSQAWQRALHKLKKGKAVPNGMAQISTWQAWSDVAAARLAEISQATLCSANPYVPELWMRVQLAWLPKPNKAPSSLRSVGLMGADTKALMVLLKEYASPFVMKALESIPQFAHRQRVSTTDAILRAGEHCHMVSKLLGSVSTSQTARILGAEQPGLIGGLMLSLDLAKAFDSLSHGGIYESLRCTGMPDYLVNLLVHIHARSVSEIAYGGHSSDVKMGQGLRQGCPVAPLVYAAWTSRLCSLLNSRIRSSWSQSTLTIYADDKFLCWQIKSERDLVQA